MPRVQAPQSLLPNQSSELLISTFILLQSAGRSITSPRFLCWPHLSDPPRHHQADIAIRPYTSSNSSVSFCKPSFLFQLPYDLPLCVICEPKSKSADSPSDRTIRALNSSIKCSHYSRIHKITTHIALKKWRSHPQPTSPLLYKYLSQTMVLLFW